MAGSEPVFDRILIVDDNPSIHDDFRKILCDQSQDETFVELASALFGDRFASGGGMGPAVAVRSEVASLAAGETFRVDFADQGVEGVRLAESAMRANAPFAMAFVDIRMPPGIDGVETTLRLWELDPNLQIVICTPYSDYNWSEMKHRLGRSDRLLLLKKPFDAVEVLQLASSLTRKRQLEYRADLRDAELQSLIEKRTNALRTLAETDSLTRLLNRSSFLSRLQRRLDGCRDIQDTHSAVLFLDLDNFKLVNDSLGHEAGDEMLIEISRRIREVCRRRNSMLHLREFQRGRKRTLDSAGADRLDDMTLPARLGGDEFAIMVADVRDSSSAEELGRELIEAIGKPIEWSDRKLFGGVSIGTVLVSGGGEASDVLRKSDTAMYDAKVRGTNQFSVFDEAMHRRVAKQLAIESGIRRALECDEFSLHVQPITCLADGKQVGFEALMRWFSDDEMVHTPDEFIPIAEENGQIIEIGQWVVHSAMQIASRYAQADRVNGMGHLTINVSRRQLIAPGFVESIVAALKRYDVPANWFGIEITETAVVETHHTIYDQLVRLRTMGFKIYLDDFGKGTSSLSFLNHFPIDILKIDRSFIVNETPRGTAILEAIVMMANALGIEVIAEGIETEEQRSRAERLGCTFGQGYLLGRPKPPEAWLGEPLARHHPPSG